MATIVGTRGGSGALNSVALSSSAAAAGTSQALGAAPLLQGLDQRRSSSRACQVAGAFVAWTTAGIAKRRTRTTLRASSYKEMKVPELKQLLRERDLPVAGRKSDLIARLEQADQEAGNPTATREAAKEPAEEKKSEEGEDEPEGPGAHPPYGSKMPDPHKGKPEVIVDDEGRKRYLCLDGQYRRGDPNCIKLEPKNFSTWLSEWVVAARTGQCEGKPQMTFLPNEPDNPGNPTGNLRQAGKTIKSEDVLVKREGADGEFTWEISSTGISLPPEGEREALPPAFR